MGENIPCYKCDNRTETCHSTCQLYIEWSNKKAEEREARRNSSEYQIEQYQKRKFSKIKKYR